MKYNIVTVAILFGLTLQSCGRKTIEITTEYVLNENWTAEQAKVGANSIRIARLKLKPDSVLNAFSSPGQSELLSKLDTDSGFIYYANVQFTQNEKEAAKVFFNRNNGFEWVNDGTEERSTMLGSLTAGNWYSFSFGPSPIYVFVDSARKVHRFNLNTANY